MPTRREQILDYLRVHPAGADDDVLAAKLGVPQRQSVNQLCRQLEAQGIVVRQYDVSAGKTVNRLADAPAGPTTSHTPVRAPAAPAPPRLPERAAVGPLVRLDDEQAVRQFAYPGEIQLAEDVVKHAVEAALQADGWSVETQWGHAHGIDIEARRGSQRLVLEAKGEGSLAPMRVNFFLGALGELLQRMDSPDARYGLALPAHRQFIGLVLRLPTWVRGHLNLCFFFVRPGDGEQLVVGLFAPEANDDN